MTDLREGGACGRLKLAVLILLPVGAFSRCAALRYEVDRTEGE